MKNKAEAIVLDPFKASESKRHGIPVSLSKSLRSFTDQPNASCSY